MWGFLSYKIMSTISNNLPAPPDGFSTTLSSSIANNALSIPLNSVSGLGTEGVGQLFKKDSSGNVVAGSIEYVHWTNVSGNTLTLSDTGDRGLNGSSSGAQAYSTGDYFEVWVTGQYYYKKQRDGFLAQHNQDGTHTAFDVDLASSTDFLVEHNASGTHKQPTTNKATPVDADTIGLFDSAASFILKNITFLALKLAIYVGIKPAEGTVWNGKIVPSVSSNNLTLALKTLAGTDPSATDPVYATIGGVVRTITSALSVTKNAATNWCNAGSAELATKEIDYFAYLGYNATDGVTIGFSRIPYANQYSDFSTTTTSEKYCAISTIANAASTDYYNVVGRFAATLSAGAGYTWSVPTFTAINLIQKPIFESRWLTWTPALTGWSGSPTVVSQYQVSNGKVQINFSVSGISNGTVATMTFPFINGDASNLITIPYRVADNSSVITTPGSIQIDNGQYTANARKDMGTGAWTNAGNKILYPTGPWFYKI